MADKVKVKKPVVLRSKDQAPILKDEQLRGEVDRLRHQLRTALTKIKTLEEQVVIDSLTKVRNRKGFDSAFERLVNQLPAVRDSRKTTLESLGLLIVDADFFKLVNDRYGHDVGDEVLVAIAQVLKSSVRSNDVVCRWGGDELVIFMPGINESGLEKVGEKIRSAVTVLNFPEIPNLQVSVSIGGSVQLHQSDTLLFDRADKALYVAKRSGRDRVIVA
jgi:diguanylate cyclase (GGDEF)-like protein